MVKWKNRSLEEQKSIKLKVVSQRAKIQAKKEDPFGLKQPRILKWVFGSDEAYIEKLCEMVGFLTANEIIPENKDDFNEIHKILHKSTLALDHYQRQCKMLVMSIEGEDLLKKINPEKHEEFVKARAKLANKILDPDYNPVKVAMSQ